MDKIKSGPASNEAAIIRHDLALLMLEALL